MLMKKRQFLTATLVLALGAAVCVNWYYTNSGVTAEGETTSVQQVSGNLGDSLYVAGTTAPQSTAGQGTDGDYFAEARLKKMNTHDEITDSIEQLIEKEALSEYEKEKIIKDIEQFKNNVKAEADAENLIKAKTSSECLVIINGDACQVIMEKNTLNDTVILQITEIITKNTNISAENLTIIELK